MNNIFKKHKKNTKEVTIVLINGKKYNITNFIQYHPGGSKVFENKHMKDITKEFNKINHSQYAKTILNNYLMDNNINNINKSKKKFSKINNLVTKSDKLHVHKLLGLYSLLFYIYYFINLYYSGFNGELTLYNKNFTISLLPLLLLSLTSFQFNIYEKKINWRYNIDKDWRVTHMIFMLRSLLIYFLSDLKNNYDIKQILFFRWILVTLAMISTDIIRKYVIKRKKFKGLFKVKKKNLYGKIITFIQIAATTSCFFDIPNFQLSIIFILQFSTFLKTLSKRNIIKENQYTPLYMFTYLFVIFGFIFDSKIYKIVFFSIPLYLLRNLNINKYLLWSCFYCYLTIKQSGLNI